MLKKTFLTITLLLTSALTARAVDNPIQEFPLASDGHRPQAITPGPDGNLWCTEVLKHKILRITPEGKITEFPILPTDPKIPVGVIQGIAAGSDGNIYFTSREENSIRRLSPKGEFNGSFTIPSLAAKPDPITKGSWPREITPGPDGNLYFVELTANKIGQINTKGEIKEFQIPTENSRPYGIVAGPDKKIWFTESEACKIGRLDPTTGKIDEFPLPTQKSLARDIAVGTDGNIYFSENIADKIGQITPKGDIKEFSLTKGTKPIGIAPGPDGNIYIACFGTSKIAQLTPAGVLTEFDLPTPKAQPFCLTLGPDKKIWIAEQANTIASLDPKNLPAKPDPNK